MTFAVVVSEDLLTALRRLNVEDVLAAVLVQLIVILLAARLFGGLARRLGQPAAVGEILAGLFLGPSLLGWLWSDASTVVFHPSLGGLPAGLSDQLLGMVFSTLSQVGLVLLLFLLGLEFDFSHLRWHGRSALAISSAGIVLPFVLGLAVAPVLLAAPDLVPEGHKAPEPLGFALFLGTALSITALPILGRILVELNIHRTRLATVAIAAAAAEDACGWILVATVAAVVRTGFDPWQTMLMIVETIAFALALVVVARPMLCRWARGVVRHGEAGLNVWALSILLVLVFGCAVITSKIGIFAIFGAFLLGAVLSGETQFRNAVVGRLEDFVTVFFLPIFFTYTGLRTQMGSLATPELWLLCGLVLVAAVLGKFIGCGLAGWATGFSPRESGCLGVMMNTRGLMELVVINLGKDLGVVPDSVYCMLVLMALATTVMTTPLLRLLAPGTELAEGIQGWESRRRAMQPPAQPVEVATTA